MSWSFSSTVIVMTHTHTHTPDRLLYLDPKWSVI